MSIKAIIVLLLVLPASVGTAQVDGSIPMDHSAHRQMANAQPLANSHDLVAAFELTGAEGKNVALSDFRGRYVLLGFGFTHCDYVCPTMAASMARVLEASSEPSVGVFVSVDSERDSPAATHRYAQGFHQRLTGLSGSYQQVAAAANNFKLTFAITKTAKSYTVQHSASIYLIDPEGALSNVFALNATTDEILAAMNGQNAHEH